jgi:hypothetical protein
MRGRNTTFIARHPNHLTPSVVIKIAKPRILDRASWAQPSTSHSRAIPSPKARNFDARSTGQTTKG